MNLYLDASVLVKLLVEEAGSERAEQLVTAAQGTATSIISYAEVRSALARRDRERGLAPGDYARAMSAFEAEWRRLAVISVDFSMVQAAATLTERQALRTLDALHLASALFLQRTGGLPVTFLSADQRLHAAADVEGLESIRLST